MGFYSNLPTGEGLRNMQGAISSLAEIQANTQKNLRENLNGIGNAIKEYANFRLYKEKTQRDEAFRQKEFDEKNRQFNVVQDNQMTQHRQNLNQRQKEWEENAPLRAAQANQANASAFNTSEEAKVKKEVRLERDRAEREHQARLKKEAEQAQKAQDFQNELKNDAPQTTTPKNNPKGLALFGALAQKIESLY